MRVGAIAETLDVVSDGVGFDATLHCALLKHNGVVDSLGTTGDFFTAHEKVIGAGKVGVIRGEHGVERSGFLGVTVQEIQVSIVFFTHKLTQLAFHFGADVLVHTLLDASIFEHLATFFEGESGNRSRNFERLERILLVDMSQLSCEALFKLCKDIAKHISHLVHQLEVALFYCEFNVQPCELAQVAMGV